MKSFREFVDTRMDGAKPWKAKKAEVLDFWKSLKPNLPLQMDPVSDGHEGTRFRQDGLRVTGSPQFINSVISRLKDMAEFESEFYRLDVEYRQIEDKTVDADQNPEFVFYVHLVKKDPTPEKIKVPTPSL